MIVSVDGTYRVAREREGCSRLLSCVLHVYRRAWEYVSSTGVYLVSSACKLHKTFVSRQAAGK